MIRRHRTTHLAAAFLLLCSVTSGQSMFEKVNDFDGDGRADFAITRDEGGVRVWHIWGTTSGHRQVQWGLPLDPAMSADYDGDGRTDVAVARLIHPFPVTLNYYILSSQTGEMIFQQVSSTAGPQWFQWVQDHDGDGKADPGIALSETHRIAFRRSTDNVTVERSFSSQVPIRLGDLDGDDLAEIVSYDSNTNVVTWTDTSNGTPHTIQFGNPHSRYIAADFDGDGKGDLAVWHPPAGEWWWIRSSDNVVNVVRWGQDGDFPVQADYDGDDKTDHAVYRRGSPYSVYYVYGSQSGYQAFIWGVQTDFPISY